MARTKKETVKKEVNFENDLEQLEKIVTALEEGGLSLDDSLKRFEEGIRLSRACEKTLSEAEKRIEILLKNSKGELEARELLEEREDEREEDAADEDAGDEYGNEEAPQPAAPRTPEKPGSGQEDLPF